MLTKRGVGHKVEKMADTIEKKVNELESSEANLVNAVSAKIDEIEGKSASMTSEVKAALSGIAKEFKQRDNQSFMNNSGIRVELDGVKLQSDTTEARLAHIENQASSVAAEGYSS